MNLSTLMVHATARSDSGEWNANPYNWVTRCGGWRWAAAGRLAKPLASKEQVGEAVSLCAKCKPAMMAEELIESSIPFTLGTCLPGWVVMCSPDQTLKRNSLLRYVRMTTQ
eukprot:s1539_g21.t1